MAASLGPILFVVVVVGGLGSLPGAFIASIAIGLIQTFAVAMNISIADVMATIGIKLDPNSFAGDLLMAKIAQVAPIIPYLLLVLVLMFRPQGLMGNRDT
jgi:branched-chain amino acid transport system permease protein